MMGERDPMIPPDAELIRILRNADELWVCADLSNVLARSKLISPKTCCESKFKAPCPCTPHNQKHE